MTKVQIRFDLERPFDDELLNALSSAHGVYGMGRITPSPDLRSVLVDYDASRLNPREVEAVLLRAGLPITARA